MTLDSLVTHYGYLALFVGTFLEGETILVLGGYFAHRGDLQLEWVILSAFIGTYTGDQLFYYIGRLRGAAILEKRPHWQLRSRRVFQLLRRHQVLVILGFRFLYGIRTVTPFIIGMSGVKPLRYLVLNGIGALVWSIVVSLLGFLLGQTVEKFLQHVKHYELLILLTLILIASGFWLIRWLREQRQIKRKPRDSEGCQE